MFKCGKKRTAREEASAKVIQDEYKKLGPMRFVTLQISKQEQVNPNVNSRKYITHCFSATATQKLLHLSYSS